jgi:tRNA (pseudouridine54-N1)-methyltransferase
MRRFVVVGQKAIASEEFRLDDLPGTSGRLDILARCLRAALLSSHGLRRDVVVYLVLLGGPRAPRVVRVDGRQVQFLRPDERSLAVLLQKVLASRADEGSSGFAPVRPGIAVAQGELEPVLADAVGAPVLVLDEAAPDIRALPDAVLLHEGEAGALFVLGDHLGIPAAMERRLAATGAVRVGIGPVPIHADDVVAVVTNELDRRKAAGSS